jgi:hypothetical protein
MEKKDHLKDLYSDTTPPFVNVEFGSFLIFFTIKIYLILSKIIFSRQCRGRLHLRFRCAVCMWLSLSNAFYANVIDPLGITNSEGLK